jgi:hypothetical protein
MEAFDRAARARPAGRAEAVERVQVIAAEGRVLSAARQDQAERLASGRGKRRGFLLPCRFG